MSVMKLLNIPKYLCDNGLITELRYDRVVDLLFDDRSDLAIAQMNDALANHDMKIVMIAATWCKIMNDKTASRPTYKRNNSKCKSIW